MNELDKRLAREAAEYLKQVRENVRRTAQEIEVLEPIVNRSLVKRPDNPQTAKEQIELQERRKARKFWTDALPAAVRNDRWWKEYKRTHP